MMGRIPRPGLTKKYRCDVCEAGICEITVENYDKPPVYCPFDKDFGTYKWIEITDEKIPEK